MAARAGTTESGGYLRLDPAASLLAMGAILASSQPSIVGVARISWSSFFAAQPKVPAFLDNFQHLKKAAGVKMGAGGVERDTVNSMIVSVLVDVLGDPDISDFGVPLMDMGLDSLSAVEFRNRVQASFEGLHLTATAMFDYPTVADLTDFIVAQFSEGDDDNDLGALGGSRELNANEPLAMIGMSARFPGCQGNGVDEYWAMLTMGQDMITPVPIERWDIDLYYDADPSAPGKMYAQYGGFILGLEGFDSKMFGIIEPEAQAMDPHQRILLEAAYESFWNAGLDKEQLSNTNCGVYIGCATLGGISVGDMDIGTFTNIGSMPSGNSGRVSHALGLRGPCFTIDTACSSTLVGVDCAAQAKRLGKCDRTCVAGSNLQLCPNTWVGFCKMGMALSPDGRCKTFNESANGFTRSEGAGSLIFELASSAAKSGKQEVANALGVCVNQDGRSATITAPSGPAQQRCINASLQDGSVKALEVSLVEVHGTGTALGDPIEVGGLKSTLGKNRTEDSPLILAAAKSIIGHTEGSAGVAGVLKMVAEFSHRHIPSNLHLKKMNPNIDLADFPTIMPSSLIDWKGSRAVAGTSSFGFSGTNSHGTLEGPGNGETQGVALERPQKLAWNRTAHRLHDWSDGLWYSVEWRPMPLEGATNLADILPCLVIGTGVFTQALQAALGAEVEIVSASKPELIAGAVTRKTWGSVVFAEMLEAEDSTLEGHSMAALLTASQAAAGLGRALRFVLLTAGAQEAQAASETIGRGLLGAAASGFMRSMPLEAPQLRSQTVDLPACFSASSLEMWVDWVKNELAVSSHAMEREVAYMGDDAARRVPRLSQHSVKPGVHRLDGPEKTQLVTGGLGGLGLLTAHALTEMGHQACCLCLVEDRLPPMMRQQRSN
jgi:3-oxoacyl-(acyl-carrier-protein) synthase